MKKFNNYSPQQIWGSSHQTVFFKVHRASEKDHSLNILVACTGVTLTLYKPRSPVWARWSAFVSGIAAHWSPPHCMCSALSSVQLPVDNCSNGNRSSKTQLMWLLAHQGWLFFTWWFQIFTDWGSSWLILRPSFADL